MSALTLSRHASRRHSPLASRTRTRQPGSAVSGAPSTVRTPEGEERLSPGDVVYFPEGPDGLHTFSNPTDESVRLLGISTKWGFPTSLPIRSRAFRG